MQEEKNTEKSAYQKLNFNFFTGKVFLKSLVWTLAALGLIAIGFFGADLLFG